MQEHQVTASGRRYVLPEPFFVLATQNPIEMEGHLSAARGATRPLHVQCRHRLPARGR
ncbi:MAG: AAA family ATPase [Chthoniobacter sp.]